MPKAPSGHYLGQDLKKTKVGRVDTNGILAIEAVDGADNTRYRALDSSADKATRQWVYVDTGAASDAVILGMVPPQFAAFSRTMAGLQSV